MSALTCVSIYLAVGVLIGAASLLHDDEDLARAVVLAVMWPWYVVFMAVSIVSLAVLGVLLALVFVGRTVERALRGFVGPLAPRVDS